MEGAPTNALPRTPRCTQSLAGPPPVRLHWPCSTDRRTPARPCDTACRTEDRSDSQALPSLSPVMPSVASEHSSEVRGSLIQSPRPTPLLAFTLNQGSFPPPALHRPRRSYEPIRHPMRPGPILADHPLTGHVHRSPHRASRVATIPLRTHPAATTPVESLGALFARFPNDHSLPRFVAGSASTSALSGPAQRSLNTLRSACSPGHLRDPLHRRLRPLRFLHDRSDCYRLERKLPGGTALPLGNRAFSRRTTFLAHSI